MEVNVFTDGSATTANLPGGYAYVIVIDGVKVHEGSGHLSSATNNVAELTAAIEGLAYVAGRADLLQADEIVLVSDSQLVLRYATGEYQCKAYHLLPLYIQLRKLYKQVGARTRWVKGHSGNEYNEVCDKLAKKARLTPPVPVACNAKDTAD